MKMLLLLLFIPSLCFAQLGKRKLEKAYAEMEVKNCKIGEVIFSKGDTITLGYPLQNKDKFSFIQRRLEWFDIYATTPFDPEKLKLDIGFSARRIIINKVYYAKDGLNSGCITEFEIAKDLYAWIMLDTAVPSKEIVKINGKPL